MSGALASFITRNPLLAHGVRPHGTGIVLAEAPRVPSAPRRRPRRPSPDAPRLHLAPGNR